MKVHLVDGTYELFRSHFGAPPATAPDGTEVGAARGLLRSLLALVTRGGATHVGCAFDHVIESFRNRMFDGYKTGAGVDPVLLAQFPLAEEASHALGLATWPMVEFEADDALAAAALALEPDAAVEQILLCSPDKDLAQCVRGRRVVGFDRGKERVLAEEDVVAKFGVPPASIPDYLALVGDDADGIPGVPRWGAKSAATVLARFGHVDRIPDDPAAWGVVVRGAAALAESLRAHRPEAALYRRLATLRTDVPIRATAADLEWGGACREHLVPLCARLGERSLLDRVPRFRATCPGLPQAV